MTATDLLSGRAASVLHEGRAAHVAVWTQRGPHVTPALYASDDDRLWFAAASPTVKAKVVATGARGAALVRAAGHSALLVGRFERLDPLSPRQLARAAGAVPRVPRAFARYTARNAIDLVAFARDTVTGRTPRLPARRVVLALVPDRVVVLHDDGVVEALGAWPGHVREVNGTSTQRGAGVASEGSTETAVVAWPGPDGPLALPARWDGAANAAAVSDQLVAITAAEPSGPAAVVVDEYRAPGPAAKRGALLRGAGSFGQVEDGWRWLHFDPETLTTWDGIDTDSESIHGAHFSWARRVRVRDEDSVTV